MQPVIEFKNELLYQQLGEAIKTIRASTGISQEELASSINVKRTSIANIESGRQNATLSLLYKITYILKINLVDFLPDTKDLFKVDEDYITINTDNATEVVSIKTASTIDKYR